MFFIISMSAYKDLLPHVFLLTWLPDTNHICHNERTDLYHQPWSNEWKHYILVCSKNLILNRRKDHYICVKTDIFSKLLHVQLKA